jgi:hypothetical protein
MGLVTEWWSDAFNILWNVLGDIVAEISRALTRTWEEICRVCTQVWAEAGTWIIIVVVIVVVIVIYYYTGGMADVSVTLEAGGGTWVACANAAAVAYAIVQDFLAYIHLGLLIMLHNMAMVLIPAYQEWVAGIYSKIADVSTYVSGNFAWLPLLLMNARTLYFDASSTLGRPYDLMELGWYKAMTDWLVVSLQKINQYKDDPSRLIIDLDNLIVKPAMDSKAGAMQFIYSFMDVASSLIKTTVKTIDKLNYDFWNVVNNLPPQIRDEATAWYKPIGDEIHRVIQVEIIKRIDATDKALGYLGDYYNLLDLKVKDQFYMITHPAVAWDYVDLLSEIEQYEQVDKVNNHTLRRTYDAIKDKQVYVQDANLAAEKAYLDMLEKQSKPPEYTPTMPAPRTYPFGPDSPQQDWEIKEVAWP